MFFTRNSVEGGHISEIEENAQKLAFFHQKVAKTRVLTPF